MRIILFFCLLGLSYMAGASVVIKCKGISGGVVYTQNANDCDQKDESVSIEYMGDHRSSANNKVNYRVPRRDYIKPNSKWRIYVESDLRWRDKALYDASLIKLNISDIYTTL